MRDKQKKKKEIRTKNSESIRNIVYIKILIDHFKLYRYLY